MTRSKAVFRKTFPKTAVFLAVCIASLVLTAWRSSSSSPQKNRLRLANQTTAFQVVNAEVFNNDLHLTFTNVSEKAINGYTLALNGGLVHTDYTISSYTIEPGQIEERTFPSYSNEATAEIEVQAVVFTDRSFNGSIAAANSILHRREGLKAQLQAIEQLLNTALQSSDKNLAASVNQLVSQVDSLPEGQQGSRRRALRAGFHDAKGDVRKMLQSAIQERSREKDFGLRQRLNDMRKHIGERVNRL